MNKINKIAKKYLSCQCHKIKLKKGMRHAILLVAYGPCHKQGRAALQAFGKQVQSLFADSAVRWAYTSELMRQRLAKKRQKSDSVAKALQRLYLEHFSEVKIQSLQTINGNEFEQVRQYALLASKPEFKISLGQPLLATPEDIQASAKAVIEHLPLERKDNEDVILMGHGAMNANPYQYKELAKAVTSLNARVHVGIMGGDQDLELQAILQKLQSKIVWLQPLLSVIGRHAYHDMAGEHQNSWRGRLEKAGFICKPLLHGLVEYSSFAKIWIEHLTQAKLCENYE